MDYSEDKTVANIMAQLEEEMREIEKTVILEDRIIADMMAQAEKKTCEIVTAALPSEKWRELSMEEIEAALADAEQEIADTLKACMKLAILSFDGSLEEMDKKGTPLGLTTTWDRKEAWEKRRSVERAAASRFRQYKARKTAWTMQKRTGPRRREWRGPWRAEKRTN